MTTITSLDLRNNYQDIGQKVLLGQSFVVTFRGKRMFQIKPLDNDLKVKKSKNGALVLLDKIKKIEEETQNSNSIIGRMTDEELDKYIFQEKTKKYL